MVAADGVGSIELDWLADAPPPAVDGSEPVSAPGRP
jgi:hypothetical protein